MKTETQQDSEVRIVALANLRAMCEYISSPMTHRFKIEKVTRSRVHVSYTGPYFDEFGYEGNDVHVVAVFPCYPSAHSVPHHSHTLILEDGTEEDVTLDDTKNPRVVLDILRILYEDEERDYDAGQYFAPLLDCPDLWRGVTPSTEWKTRKQWEKEKGRDYRYPKKGSMVHDALPSILREYVDRREGHDPLNAEILEGTGRLWRMSVNEEMEDLLEGFVHVYMRRDRKG